MNSVGWCTSPTERFAPSEPQKHFIKVFELNRIRRSTDIERKKQRCDEELKLRKMETAEKT